MISHNLVYFGHHETECKTKNVRRIQKTVMCVAKTLDEYISRSEELSVMILTPLEGPVPEGDKPWPDSWQDFAPKLRRSVRE